MNSRRSQSTATVGIALRRALCNKHNSTLSRRAVSTQSMDKGSSSIKQRVEWVIIIEWVILIVLVAACAYLAFEDSILRWNTSRACVSLNPVLKSDPRFQGVRLWWVTDGSIHLHGTVASAQDLDALHQIVEQVHLLFPPSFSVRVDTSSPPTNTILAPPAASPSQ